MVENTSITEREKILGRIREALRMPAPVAGHHEHARHSASEVEAAAHISEWLPATGETLDEWMELFRANSADLRTELIFCDDSNAAAAALASLATAAAWQKIAAHRGSFVVKALEKLDLPVCWADSGYEPAEMETCDVGITECDALVAQTGSVLVSTRSAGGRALSILPPHHVVLATREQFVPDLPAAIALLKERYAPDYPSMMSFITGPSRTGDIERILVLGAHGPKRLTVICSNG